MEAVIDKQHHNQLLRKWPGLAARANIAEFWIERSVKDYCSDSVVKYLRNLRVLMGKGRGGLMLSESSVRSEDRCSVIAAACFRNYIDAKVMSLNEVLDVSRKQGVPETSVILIPDFYVYDNPLATWQIAALLSFLSQRHQKAKATIIYVRNLTGVRNTYGEEVYSHLKDLYVKE